MAVGLGSLAQLSGGEKRPACFFCLVAVQAGLPAWCQPLTGTDHRLKLAVANSTATVFGHCRPHPPISTGVLGYRPHHVKNLQLLVVFEGCS